MRAFAPIALLGAAALWASACGGEKPPATPEPPVAEPAPPPSPAPPPPPPPSLYERLGKRDGLTAVVDELMGNVLADNRISKLFDKDKKDKQRAKQLHDRFVEELCVLAGGDDCHYDGKAMKDAHAGMHITDAQWSAFVEDLTIALETRNVDDALSKELVDKLESDVKTDVVSAGKGR